MFEPSLDALGVAGGEKRLRHQVVRVRAIRGCLRDAECVEQNVLRNVVLPAAPAGHPPDDVEISLASQREIVTSAPPLERCEIVPGWVAAITSPGKGIAQRFVRFGPDAIMVVSTLADQILECRL